MSGVEPALSPGALRVEAARLGKHPDPAIPTDPIYRLSVEQYHAMIEAGILVASDPVELLEGWLVQRRRKTPAHVFATGQLARLLMGATEIEGSRYIGRHHPITMTESEPEPDVSIVRGACLDYATRHPTPAEVDLVAEVADSSLQTDQTTKKRVYARAGVAEYWIVNLVDRRVEVYTGPSGPTEAPGYAQSRHYGMADEVPLVLDGAEVGRIRVADLIK